MLVFKLIKKKQKEKRKNNNNNNKIELIKSEIEKMKFYILNQIKSN